MTGINEFDVPYHKALSPKFRTVCDIAPELLDLQTDKTLCALNAWAERHCEGRFRIHARKDSSIEAYFSRQEEVDKFDRELAPVLDGSLTGCSRRDLEIISYIFDATFISPIIRCEMADRRSSIFKADWDIDGEGIGEPVSQDAELAIEFYFSCFADRMVRRRHDQIRGINPQNIDWDRTAQLKHEATGHKNTGRALRDRFEQAITRISQEIVERHKRIFKAENELTDDEFADDHWQTLFAIQCPQPQIDGAA